MGNQPNPMHKNLSKIPKLAIHVLYGSMPPPKWAPFRERMEPSQRPVCVDDSPPIHDQLWCTSFLYPLQSSSSRKAWEKSMSGWHLESSKWVAETVGFCLLFHFLGFACSFLELPWKSFDTSKQQKGFGRRILPTKFLKQFPCPEEPLSSCHFRGTSHFGFFIPPNQHQRPKHRWSNHAWVMKRSLVVDAKQGGCSSSKSCESELLPLNSSWVHGSQSYISLTSSPFHDESWEKKSE